MMRRLLVLVTLFLGFTCSAAAQLLQWTPNFIDEAAGSVVITADANLGNKGLLNHAATDVYVHTGVITTKSTGPTDWKYSKFTWGTTNAAAQAATLGSNKWSYTITGGLRAFYGITDPTESIIRIAILFRSGDGNKKLANADGSDMYVPVVDNSALQLRITNPFQQPKYNLEPEALTPKLNDVLPVTAVTNRAANLTLKYNGNTVATAANATTISGNVTFTAEGSQTVVVEAVEGSVTRTQTLTYFIAPSGRPLLPLPAGTKIGINYHPTGDSVTLVLFAPGKTSVRLLGDFNNWTDNVNFILNQTPDQTTWWITLKGLTPGQEYAYQYVVDNTLRIADPYTEKILDPQDDPFISAQTYPGLKPYPTGKTTGNVSVLQPGKAPYVWQVPNFQRPAKWNIMTYELLVRDFVKNRNWNALKDTLDYIQRQGINALEIMPFNEFEGNISWGYNGSFFFAPDKYYGTENALKTFIDECHKRGIAVILDLALNHQFGESPMVQLYWDAVNNKPSILNPWFNPDAKHPFNVGYDMNHESARTQYYFSRVVEHWLKEYKLDGFRFDLSKGYTQKNTGNDVSAWSQYDASRVAIWKQYYDTCQKYGPGSYVILEHFADNTEERELANYGLMFWGNIHGNYTNLVSGNPGSDFNWAFHTNRGWNEPNVMAYGESHDEERLMVSMRKSGNSSNSGHDIKNVNVALKRMELYAALNYLIPGPKMVWQFGELGYDVSINFCNSTQTESPNCRLDERPLKWEYFNEPARKALYDAQSKIMSLRYEPLIRDVFRSSRITARTNETSGIRFYQVGAAGASGADTAFLLVVGNAGVTATSSTITLSRGGLWKNHMTGELETLNASHTFSLNPGDYKIYFWNERLQPTGIRNPVATDATFKARVFPNPVQPSSLVVYELPENGNVRLALLSATGQVLNQTQLGYQLKGEQRIPLQKVWSNSLAAQPGTYLLQINVNNTSRYIKLLVQ